MFDLVYKFEDTFILLGLLLIFFIFCSRHFIYVENFKALTFSSFNAPFELTMKHKQGLHTQAAFQDAQKIELEVVELRKLQLLALFFLHV